MLKYKLTDQNMQTHNGCQWEIGVAKTTDGHGELCNSGWLHFYDDPILAVFMNPIHAKFKNPRIFECNAEGIFKDDHGLKSGCTKLTLVREIELPVVSDVQRVAFGILCVKQVFQDENWGIWADNWLDGTDRSAASAAYAATVHTIASFAAYAAYAAAYAAYAASSVASSFSASFAAFYATHATYVPAFNLVKIAHKALKEN